MQFGVPINSVSVKTHLHYVYEHFEIGAGLQSKIFFSGLGPQGLFFENRMQVDAKLVWGRNFTRNPQFMHAMFNNSSKANSLGYAYFWYWDTRETSQRSGAWSAEIGNSFVYFENDLFAGQGRDRFRTGTLRFMYRDSLNIWSLNTRIWTGETRGAKIVESSNYKSARGYKDLSNTRYGTYSNGIFSLGYHRATNFLPIGIELGVDDERIRDLFQNKLIHDFPYFIKRNPARNRHLPMLDKDGLPFIDTSKQQIRKTKFVFQANFGFEGN